MPVQKKLSAKSKQKAPTKRTYVTKSKKPTFLESLLTGKRKWAVVGVCLVLFGAVGTYMLRPSSADSLTKTSNCRQYSIKDSRTKYTCVKYIQEMINGTNVYKLPTGGYSYRYHPAMLKVDGYYGAKTKAGVVSFQKSTKNNGTPLAVDGVTGPKTWGELCYRVRTMQGLKSTYPLISNAYIASRLAGCTGPGR